MLCAKTGALPNNAAPLRPNVANQTARGNRMAIGADALWVTDLQEGLDKRIGTAKDNDSFQIAREKRPVSAVCLHKVKYRQF